MVPGHRLCVTTRKVRVFYYFVCSSIQPPSWRTSLSATRYGLFNIFTASLCAWRMSSPHMRGNSPYRCDGDNPPHILPLEYLLCLKCRVHVKRVTLTCEICCVRVFVTICHHSGMYTVLLKKNPETTRVSSRILLRLYLAL
jgi:hypothetical protein